MALGGRVAPGLAAVLASLVVSTLPAPPATADVECTVGKTRYVETPSYALVRLAAAQAWQLSVGEGTTVAVVDSGVEDDNAHLQDVVLPGTSFVSGEPDATEDDWGHGTAIAGIIAGQFLEQSSVIGLAPGAEILPVRVFRAESTTGSTPSPEERPSTDRMAAGIRWAAEQGVDVINVSMSTTTDDPALRSAVRFAARQDIVIVASGGNRASRQDPDGPRYPAAYADVIGVAASDSNDTVTDDSIHGEHIDVYAPGQDVLTTYFGNGDCLLGTDRPYSSYAAGYVSALAAMLREQFPRASAEEVAYRIMAGADRPQRSERDDVRGWGLIQPYSSLTMTPDPSRPGPSLPGAAAPDESHTQPVVAPVSAAPDPLVPAQQTALWWSLILGGLVVLAVLLRPWVMRRAARGPSEPPAVD